ncbi:MAG: translation elongation factor Ts [Chloroflexi bacterium]|nr:translation elongation factor Ts [Chloroflexota bacterium]
MEISAAMVKALREATGAGVMDCKRALAEAGGDVAVAKEILRKQGMAIAEKKVSRVASQGLVESYLHAGGRIGAMVEINCETDFVARTPEFKDLAHNLAMQVAATGPLFVRQEEMPAENDLVPEEACLLLQSYIKSPDKKVQDIVMEAIAKTGENIVVRRFCRFELGG